MLQFYDVKAYLKSASNWNHSGGFLGRKNVLALKTIDLLKVLFEKVPNLLDKAGSDF